MGSIIEIPVDAAEEFIHSLADEVKHKLKDNYQLVIHSDCTGFIFRCLRIKDYDTEKAAKLVKNFAKSTQQLHDLLEKFQPKFYKDVYLNGTFSILNSRDHLGRQIVVSRIGGWDPKVHDFDEAACAGMLLFSFAVGQSTETQRKGIVFVHDLSGFGMQHVKAVKPGRLTQIVGLMQDGSPGRIKGVHFVFHPRMFSVIYQMVKPFLKEKLAKRIFFHGDNLSSLHRHIGLEHLPKSLGGIQSEKEAVDLPLLQNLMNEETIHEQLMMYGVPYL